MRQVALPEDPPWWELFEVTRAELAKVCRVMTALYQQPKAVYVPLQQLSAGLASPAASPLLANGAPAQANGAARPAGAPGSSAGCPSPAEPRVSSLLRPAFGSPVLFLALQVVDFELADSPACKGLIFLLDVLPAGLLACCTWCPSAHVVAPSS